MVYVLRQHQRHDGTIGRLPAWWYRVFYAYTVTMIRGRPYDQICYKLMIAFELRARKGLS